MSKSTANSGNETGGHNQFVNEINEIFMKHYEGTKRKHLRSMKKLDHWCVQHIKETNDHVEEQKRLLTETYDNQKRAFDKQFRENLHTAETYCTERREDLLDELLDACRALKFKFARLTYSKWELERPEVTVEVTQMEEKDPEPKSRLSAARSRRRQVLEGSKKAEDASGPSALAPSDTTTSSTEPGDDRPSPTTKSRREHSPKDDWTDKCPLCFMIFPTSLTTRARQEHVNEHME